MKILLLGEYSNLHWTLAEGLKELGHDVTVASDGDGFKNYARNIDLSRKSSSIKDTLEAIIKVIVHLYQFRGYDVVQLINPCFTTLSVDINKYIYRFLRKNNKKLFLGAFGDDTFWLKACLDNSTFRYSEFYVDNKPNNLKDNDRLKSLWLDSNREILNKEIATSCDGIIACLCEYYLSYKKYYPQKLTYIPLPINLEKIEKTHFNNFSDTIKFFIGINKDRSEFKGTNRMYNVLRELQLNYPKKIEINTVESVPYNEYIHLMKGSDIVLDQLYSYSPAMNGLLALAQQKVLISGAEPEMYCLLQETDNQPIINVVPNEKDIYDKLEYLVLNKDLIPIISNNSRSFVEKHHNHISVAQKYIEFWNSK